MITPLTDVIGPVFPTIPLIQSTIQGIPPGMPPRGLCMQCSDEELAATVRFMLKVSR